MSEQIVEADTENNLLRLRFAGTITEEESDDDFEELRDAVEKLEPGFGVITDIRDFKPSSQEVAENLEEGKQFLAESGAAAAVRVVGESVIGKMQFERYGDEDYYVATAETVEQAEELLEEFLDE